MAGADHYDVIIIGSGAGGGTLAWRLAPSGKRILLLERGGYLPRERDNWETEAVFLTGKYLTTERWLDVDGNGFTPEQNYNVGGNTKFYGAALFRLRPEDFGELTHHGGLSPAWPITYDELEPYYAAGRGALRRARPGRRGPDRRSPQRRRTRTRRSSTSPASSSCPTTSRRLGLHPSHLPIGVMLDQDDAGDALPSSRCIRCDRVDGFPCLVEGKADAQVVCVDPALAHPNLELVTNAKVERLETDAGGRQVTAVVATLGDGSGGPLLRRHRRGLVRRAQLGAAAAALGQRRPSPPGWPTGPTRSGATTCATTTWP